MVPLSVTPNDPLEDFVLSALRRAVLVPRGHMLLPEGTTRFPLSYKLR